jgi:shikimate kinase
MTKPSIILIGPMSAGKSTIHKALSEALGYTALELDELRWDYYTEIGYDKEKERKLREEEGLGAVLKYWKPFEVHAVERVLKTYPENHVVAFGAGHSVYEDKDLFQRAKEALAPFPYVILLLPTEDMTANEAILRARFHAAEPEMPEDLLDTIMGFNRVFLTHPSNARLATHTVYTEGKSVEESCAEIMRLISAHL